MVEVGGVPPGWGGRMRERVREREGRGGRGVSLEKYGYPVTEIRDLAECFHGGEGKKCLLTRNVHIRGKKIVISRGSMFQVK